jgi:hypothetical protein
MVNGLRASGRVTADVAGHQIDLDGGRLLAVDGGRLVSVDGGPAPWAPTPSPVPRAGWVGRDEADELLAVGRWLRREARAGRVRLVSPLEGPAAAALAAVLDGIG